MTCPRHRVTYEAIRLADGPEFPWSSCPECQEAIHLRALEEETARLRDLRERARFEQMRAESHREG
jgi:hypothetical protein